ncbi:UNVERIFIED_CONTAM: hypothetical protein K2H54_059958 [Gekko kuhli]
MDPTPVGSMEAERRDRWQSVLQQTGFKPIVGILEMCSATKRSSWVTSLGVWAFLVSQIDGRLGTEEQLKQPKDDRLWNQLQATHRHIIETFAGRRSGYQCRAVRGFSLRVVEQLFTADKDIIKNAGTPPEWASIKQLAVDLTAIADDLNREKQTQRARSHCGKPMGAYTQPAPPAETPPEQTAVWLTTWTVNGLGI